MTSYTINSKLASNDGARSGPFRIIGILHHPKKPESLDLAHDIEQQLSQLGVNQIWHASAWDVDEVIRHLPAVDLLITLGGDGTMLRAARVGARYSVPMLGVKMGRLGFLAELAPDHWREPLGRFLAGDYWVEERLMVRACVQRVGHNGAEPEVLVEYDALNDVVLSRGDLARVVRIGAQLDGGYLTTYTCDGLIISTPTGSTGYALAVHGPILPPEARNMLVIPIAPHLSMDRAIVLPEESQIRLQALPGYDPVLTVDGQVMVAVEDDHEVVVSSSPHVARFIRLRERSYFYQSLMDKLRWAG
ncbi:MAG TPA: NAD(+)/NADH kinase [Caldilineaceae bacterium]|nr:NAD(+)/NADH kinase [Caldilineaceae bacterium]